MQHAGQLQQQHEGVIKSVLKLDLDGPHVDERLMLELLLVQVLKTAARKEVPSTLLIQTPTQTPFS